jgi:2-polyprenyl-3-methyl-5-hydroxy-6-metoxy-1,4-benzoquinol methylase
MTTKEEKQENQYHFPYHHLTHETNGALYIFRHLFWGLEHLTYITFVIEQIKQHQPNTLADVGCGEGRIIAELQPHFAREQLAGYDISERAIGFAKAFTPHITFATHNIVAAPLATTYDAIVSCEVIEHIKPNEVDQYAKHIADSLKPGGTLFLTTPTTNIPTSAKHYQHFTQETLMAHLAPYFSIEEVVYLNQMNRTTSLLSRLLANRFYLSNWPWLNSLVLATYRRRYLIGNEKTGSRIYLKLTKTSA